MSGTTSGEIRPASGVAQRLAVLTGVAVLGAPSIYLVLTIPTAGDSAALLLNYAVGLIVFELIVWWKPVSIATKSPKLAVSIIFCLGTLATQVPWVLIATTSVVMDSYLDLVAAFLLKAAIAAGTWVLQASELGDSAESTVQRA